MKQLLFFSVESANRPFDAEMNRLLTEDQKKHGGAYQMESIRVRVGAQQDGLQQGGVTEWSVCTSGLGNIVNLDCQREKARQLSVFLYDRIVKNACSGCAAVFISNGEPAASTTAIQLSKLISDELYTLYPVRIHLFILQSQFVHGDPRVARLMKQVEMSNGNERMPTFYTAQYLLPWEEAEEVRENTRQTISALVKTMMMAEQDPMMLKHDGMRMWMETAAVRRLEAPVERINNVIFKYLSNHFFTNVLQPAVKQDLAAAALPKGAKNCELCLAGYVNEIERKTLLPTMGDLLCIMPLRNPQANVKPDPNITVNEAWDAIYNIYGHEKGAEIQRLLNPDFDELEVQYEQLSHALSAELLRQVLQLARDTAQEFAVVPILIKQIGDSLIKNKNAQHQGSLKLDYDHALIASREKKEAIAMAKIRHHYLQTVYEAADRRLSEKRRQMCAHAMEDAVMHAQQFIRNCLARLFNDYKQMSSIYLSRKVETHCFDVQLESAYEYWCGHNSSLELLTARDLYDLFSDEVFMQDAEKGAGMVCDGLLQRLQRNAAEAMETIRVDIISFFSELSFRAKLLEHQGMMGDLNRLLMEYLYKQVAQSPILYQQKAGNPIDIRARALIIHKEKADEFVAMAERANIAVVNDPYEKGVQMIVKYAGNALDDVLIYKGNPIPAQPN